MTQPPDQRTASTPQQVQDAVSYFQEHSLTRFLQRVYDRYQRTGSVEGNLRLDQPTEQERFEIATLLQRPPTQSSFLSISVARIDRTLQASRFHCSLREIMLAFFWDRPPVTKKEQRHAQAQQETAFRLRFTYLLHSFDESSSGYQWLQKHENWFVSYYKHNIQNNPFSHPTIINTLSVIATALNQLPVYQGTSLAVFSEHLTGDPHFLDLTVDGGRLFLKALETWCIQTSQDILPQHLSQRQRALVLYESVGLINDTVSSTVTISGLAGATLQDGTTDLPIVLDGTRIHRFPLCRLREWQELSCYHRDIFLVENPPVFETLYAQQRRVHPRRPAILICTWGWPSIATRMAIDLLLTSEPDACLHYSGDFDAKGLQIAVWLHQRYPHHIQFWRMDVQSYQSALQQGGCPASTKGLLALTKLPPSFHEVVDTIHGSKTWAYQEGIVPLLLHDLLEASDREEPDPCRHDDTIKGHIEFLRKDHS